jgi:hypothetical protein
MVVVGPTCRVTKARGAKFVVDTTSAPLDEKFCYQCRKWKPLSEYYKNKRRYDGLCSECKECDLVNRNSYRK